MTSVLARLRTFKERLLPPWTLRRQYYDWFRSGFKAAPEHSRKVGERNGVAEIIAGESVFLAGCSLPLPPDDLCMRVGGTKGDEFLTQGTSLQACLIHSLPQDFSWSGKRVCDFGCGVGRVLRHFAPQAAETEFWGADIHEPSITWLANNMGRIFRVIKTDTEPKLPFPSNYFDLIYSVSVFTHLYRGWDRWLEEIKRVLAPEGKFLCTFHSRKAYEWIINRRFEEKSIGMKVYFKNRPWDWGGPQIFHSDWWVVKNWGKILPVRTIIKEGLVNWQSIAVMQKAANSEKERVRFLQPFPYSPWNPIFAGNLDYDALAPRSWLDEHGLRYQGAAEVRGWFSSAAGPIEDIRFFVDGRMIEPRMIKTDPGVLEETNRSKLFFKAVLDLYASSEGIHQGNVTAIDNSGNKHTIEFTLYRGGPFSQQHEFESGGQTIMRSAMNNL